MARLWILIVILFFGLSFGLSFGLALGPLGAVAAADDSGTGASGSTETPTLREPSYPNEPQKKSSAPVDTGTFVEGATEPPKNESLIPRLKVPADQWMISLTASWFYSSQSQDHDYDPVDTAHSAASDALSLGLRGDFRAPWAPVSVALRTSVTSGNVEATPSNSGFAVDDYTGTSAGAFGGLRLHLFPRSSNVDVRIGADAGWSTEPYTILAEGASSLANQDRQEILILPCVEFKLDAGNWSFEVLGRYGMLERASPGDLVATDYRRIEGRVAFSRYLSERTALGFSAEYMNERANWTETTPQTFNEFAIAQDLRLGLFVRLDY